MSVAGLAVTAGLLMAGGLYLRNRVDEKNRATAAAGLVQQLIKADTPQVPAIVKELGNYRRWVDPELKQVVGDAASDPRARLHASLGLLAVDKGQVPYLEGELLEAAPADLRVLRDALTPHRADLALRLWGVLDTVKAGDTRLLPAAGALAAYEPESPLWADRGGKVAEALAKVNPVFLGQWLDALRPVRAKLTAPLAKIFGDKARTETEHSIATSTLADYAADDPAQLANLLMDADPKSYLILFPVAQKLGDKTLPAFQAELGKTAKFELGRTAHRSDLDQARRRAGRPDRGERRPRRRAVRRLPGAAARRLRGDRRGPPSLGLSPAPLPTVRRRPHHPRRRRLGPRRPELPARLGTDR